MFKCLDTLDRMMRLNKRVLNKEHRLSIGDDGTNEDFLQPFGGNAAAAAAAANDGRAASSRGPMLLGPGVPLQPLQPLQPMTMGAVPTPGQMQYGAPTRAPMSADERKFAAADTDGDGLVSEAEARDYINYHAVADTDGDGKIDLKELMRYLQPIEQQCDAANAPYVQQVGGMEEERRGQLAQLDTLRRELASLGVSDEEIAEVARKKGSSLCSIM